ncbi:hypothetical protein RFI_08178 [Reticulomyxa filosa]|uniref:Uncharacterized protein n=1 Tax=Reticulomyxa filosa TaxID=46433 RepID=X6NSP6_RETFI|nr:hypothetical protein RFI_08178 [Reticulomyxa filosa]|eukprot:ETO28948.1 hypothetical protein RFI_08178 [Reticulomyxa filosa]
MALLHLIVLLLSQQLTQVEAEEIAFQNETKLEELMPKILNNDQNATKKAFQLTYTTLFEYIDDQPSFSLFVVFFFVHPPIKIDNE